MSQFLLIGFVTSVAHSSGLKIGLGLLHVLGTVFGSMLMHDVSIRWLERGKRKVGS